MPSLEFNLSPRDLILVSSIVIAFSTWILSARSTLLHKRNQHTINTMLHANFSDSFGHARSAVAVVMKSAEIPDDFLDKEIYSTQRDSVRVILNHYEFVCAGMRLGNFDERTIINCEKYSIIRYYEFFKPYIKVLREQRGRRNIYEHLEWTHARWCTPKFNIFIWAWEKLTARPYFGKRNG